MDTTVTGALGAARDADHVVPAVHVGEAVVPQEAVDAGAVLDEGVPGPRGHREGPVALLDARLGLVEGRHVVLVLDAPLGLALDEEDIAGTRMT
jgi:hypothetical protein